MKGRAEAAPAPPKPSKMGRVLPMMQMPESPGGSERDPVCGMSVDPSTAKFRHEHDGKIYYFCSAGCQRRFEAAPATFLR